ncbi:colanic acid biosynthesis glycosyltransferase Wc aL [Desulfonema ishimotonii]|uniref:Colanic acid biosynthesis glycosyltransferase Wc aL n=1 Tax=Desulfonema ishimotonii TaxID=45657 RepID=A0A401G1V8_9BACT|nr:glycosyltransferase family 4 protein [Desulfonema ishimotonii]GBC63212.1 colanic acid biosynthesis glycosyltransferase Wc aL [Desulfonema ishimotonii]
MKENRTGKNVLGMILKGYPRISETFISNEILLLEQMGFSVRIISMRHPREPFCHDSVRQIRAGVDYLPQTILEALPQLLYHNLRVALCAPRRYAGAVRVAFRRFLRTRKSATLKHLLQAGYMVDKFLPGRNVVHLHAHFAHSPTSVAMFASRLSGLPFSFTGHAKDIYTSDPRQLREKIGMARFVATCTEYNRRHLAGLGNGAGTPLYRVYHGIDVGLFNGDGEPAAPAEPYRLMTVARMVPKKGLPTVYKALRLLRDQGITFQHTLIGDGDDREKILALIGELGLTDCCRWLGTLPHEKVLAHYRAADLFVLGCEQAANGDRDGIPNVFTEAMAMGVPVVSTRVSAIPELIRDGETGLLVSPGHPGAMAEAMLRLLRDTGLRKHIIRAAGALVRREFDNRKLIQALGAIYRNEQPLLQNRA